MAILTGTDCTITRLNSGIEGCQVIEGLPNGVILVPKAWSLVKATDTFDKAYVQEQCQLGNFIPLVGCFEAISETPDATTQESQSGLMEVVRQGKTIFTCTYKNGLAFQKIAYSLNSYNQYDVLITYETGVIKCAESVDGTLIKGLTIGMLNTNGYTENNGSNSASTILKFQITDPFEYNKYVILLSDLDFNPNTEIFGITDCVLSGTADASDNKAYVSVTWLHNEQLKILGLSTNNFRLTINGVANTITAVTYNSTTGLYALTPTATLVATDVVVVQLYDATVPTTTAKVGNKLYRGTTPSIVTVA